MNFRFYLKEANKSGYSAIQLVIEQRGIRKKYNTGFSVPPAYWDKHSKRAKYNKNYPQANELNTALQNIITGIDRGLLQLRNEQGRDLTAIDIENIVKAVLNRSITKKITLLEFIDILINEKKDKENTKKKYITIKLHLENFIKYSKKNSIDFHDINYSFLNEFREYSYGELKHNPNTLDKYLTIIKTILREAQKRQLHNNQEYQLLQNKKVATHEIFLNEAELEKIYNLDLSHHPTMEITRDLFIVGAYTGGLRFSDWSKLQTENVFLEKEQLLFRYVSQKTKTEVVLPLSNSFVKEILEKYNYKLPLPLSNPKSNIHLKEIGKLAGIDTPTKRIRYIGDECIEETVFKYELICTHTARRSFATNLTKHNIPLYNIRLLTGHSSVQQLETYLKESALDNALNMAQSTFFQ